MEAPLTPSHPRRGFVVGFAVGLTIVLVVLAGVRAWALAPLVGWFDPVVKFAQVLPGASLHSDGVGSFYIRTEKRKPGKPEFWVFFLVTGLGQGIPLDVYRARARSCEPEVPTAMVDHAPWDPWTQHYCFHLGPRFDLNLRYQVAGEIGHKTWPLGVVVTTSLPTFPLASSPTPYHNSFGELS